MTAILLNEESIIRCKTCCSLIYVAGLLALIGNTVLVGVCEGLHDEDSISQLNSAVAVCIAVSCVLVTACCGNCCSCSIVCKRRF